MNCPEILRGGLGWCALNLWTEPGPFTTAELAAACRVSQRYVQKAIDAGSLRACRVGRLLRIPASAARRFALELGVEAPAHLANEAHDANRANPNRQTLDPRPARVAGSQR